MTLAARSAGAVTILYLMDEVPTSRVRPGTFATTGAWLVGSLLVLAGLGAATTASEPEDPVLGVALVGVGLFLLPPIHGWVERTLRVKLGVGLRVGMVLAVLVLVGLAKKKGETHGYVLRREGQAWIVSRADGLNLVDLVVRIGDRVSFKRDGWMLGVAEGWPAVRDYQNTGSMRRANHELVALSHEEEITNLVATGEVPHEVADRVFKWKETVRAAGEARRWLKEEFAGVGTFVRAGTQGEVTGLVHKIGNPDPSSSQPEALGVCIPSDGGRLEVFVYPMSLAEVGEAFHNPQRPHRLHEVRK